MMFAEHRGDADGRVSRAALVDAFKDAMGLSAAGVVLVTTRLDGHAWGTTVSACCSVSANPPLLLVSLETRTVSARSIEENRAFGVNVLSEKHVSAAQLGAARGEPKHVDELCETSGAGPAAPPAVKDAVAHLACGLERAVPVRNHTLFIGRVAHVQLSLDGDRPLVYYDRSYRRIGSWPADDAYPAW